MTGHKLKQWTAFMIVRTRLVPCPRAFFPFHEDSGNMQQVDISILHFIMCARIGFLNTQTFLLSQFLGHCKNVQRSYWIQDPGPLDPVRILDIYPGLFDFGGAGWWFVLARDSEAVASTKKNLGAKDHDFHCQPNFSFAWLGIGIQAPWNYSDFGLIPIASNFLQYKLLINIASNLCY